MRCYLILIGPPAVGKSTLALNLSFKLKNSKVISFDEEFPLNKIIENEAGKKSKDFRTEFFEKIRTVESNFKWIIIDDTSHYLSMQKRYLKLESEDLEGCRVIFLYISAKNDQIPELKRRNLARSSLVKCEEIDRITTHLNSSQLIKNNLIHFNFESIPEINELTEIIKEAVKNYKRSHFVASAEPSGSKDSSNVNQLYLALNKEIFRTFQEGKVKENGKEISTQKKLFLSKIRRQYENIVPIEELVLEFKTKYLNQS